MILSSKSCSANVTARSGNYCASGDETGLVKIWDITQVPHPSFPTRYP
jgi:hypothetical protein